MADYFSPDGGGSGKETPTKDCDTCKAKGWVYRTFWFTHQAMRLLVKLPTYRACPICYGCGVVDLDETEIWINEQSRLEDEADLRNDK